ncbi:MAG: amidohydrolase family protein [Alphaproteobacteria bacterium]|nr:amidohydrolase family protein [Alphaproteobacteria bacterium]
MRDPLDLDPDGARLPIKVDTATNGEFFPLPLTRAQKRANALAHRRVGEAARRVGMGRRMFLKSACGAAATLLALDEANAARGGRFAIPAEARWEPAAADAALAGGEVVIDMQTHCVDPAGAWAKGADGERWARTLTQIFGQRLRCSGGPFDCYSAEQLVKDVFLDSDTDAAVVSALWGAPESNPTPPDYAARARDIVAAAGGRKRLLIHGGVLPNAPGQIEFMDVLAKQHRVDAWKLYPQWGPAGTGFHMDDPRFGIPVLERARALGVTVVCAHRGLPLPFLDAAYSHPGDIARVARLFPDLTFLCFHSGFEPGYVEGPYDPGNQRGVDRFVRAARDAGFRPNQGNLYAELGSVWRHYMSKPDQAAHLMGKLLATFGEERICWGTDSVWYGSPQDQIQAFRAFEITPEFQERFGYPALTRTAKAKILGLNAARIHAIDTGALRRADGGDAIDRLRADYCAAPNPSFATYGPKTRREMLRHLAAGGVP